MGRRYRATGAGPRALARALDVSRAFLNDTPV
jgi:hypothetical protein